MLREAGDPDYAWLRDLESGVALGVDGTLPRVPAVFEPKTKWRLDDEYDAVDQFRDNYSSAEEHLPAIRALFQEQADLGFMYKPSRAEALRRFGPRLHVASLGVVADPGKKI